MSIRHLLALAACALLLPAAGCFSEPKPNCAFLCSAETSCPEGYACGDDGRCHLKNDDGSLAMCSDELPLDGSVTDAGIVDAGTIDTGPDDPDAAPIDASIDASPDDPDAAPIDASPPDAAPNSPPVLGAVTSATVRAGVLVTRTLTATDPNVGDTLTFTMTWAGTNRDPYESRAGAPADVVGAAFNPGSQVFAIDTTCLGRYDLVAEVSDGAGGTDSQNASFTVTAPLVLINEIQIGATADLQNVELLNTGASSLAVGNMQVCSGTDCFRLPAGTTIAGNGVLVIHNDVGTDDADNIFAAGALGAFDAAEEVVLIENAGALNTSCQWLDYVAFGSGASRRAQGVFAGHWPSTSAVIDTTGIIVATSTIARGAGGTNTEAPDDFAIDDTPTLGAIND